MKRLYFVWIIDREMAFFLPSPMWAKAEQRWAGFRVMLKYLEIKKPVRYFIKQIDSMLRASVQQ